MQLSLGNGYDNMGLPPMVWRCVEAKSPKSLSVTSRPRALSSPGRFGALGFPPAFHVGPNTGKETGGISACPEGSAIAFPS